MTAVDAAVWIFLAAGSIYDGKYQRIPVALVAVGALAGVVLGDRGTPAGWMYCLLPGMGMLLVAFLTGEKVGYGDGLFLCALGLLTGVGVCLTDMMLGLLLGSGAGLILLVLKKGTVRTQIPFVPFLLAGHILQRIWGGSLV